MLYSLLSTIHLKCWAHTLLALVAVPTFTCNTFSLAEYSLAAANVFVRRTTCGNKKRERWPKGIYVCIRFSFSSSLAEIPCENNNLTMTDVFESFEVMRAMEKKNENDALTRKKTASLCLISFDYFNFVGRKGKNRVRSRPSIGSAWFVNWLHLLLLRTFHESCKCIHLFFFSRAFSCWSGWNVISLLPVAIFHSHCSFHSIFFFVRRIKCLLSRMWPVQNEE